MMVSNEEKQWLVVGIAINKVAAPVLRDFIKQGMDTHYTNLDIYCLGLTTPCTLKTLTYHQVNADPNLKHLKFQNINNNLHLHGKKKNLYDYHINSPVDLAKLFLPDYLAEFSSFDESLDMSAILRLLGFNNPAPIFPSPNPMTSIQTSADDVRENVRNKWGHCNITDWTEVLFNDCFSKLETLVRSLGLTGGIEKITLDQLSDWQTKGTVLCMSATMDPDLLKLVQQLVNTLKTDVEQLTFEVQEDRQRVSQALKDISASLEELKASVLSMQLEQEVMRQEQSLLSKNMDTLQTDMDTTQVQVKNLQSQQEDVQQRVAHVEEQLNRGDCCYETTSSVVSQEHLNSVSVEIASFEADIAFFAKRHDSDTRQWFFDDFYKWFHHPGDSRAYVLLGDPGVGKSVMAAVLVQRMRKSEHLGAAYFCRHNDGTRNDPRHLLGTIACQLCERYSQYNTFVGGESVVRNFLRNSKLGVQELFTKLLQEPLAKCNPSQQRKLVIIDALDETEYESREDFLDLIMHRFPLLPNWLVFFITSRPEDSVQFRLKKYNPCVKICAGNSDHYSFYQQHEQDIEIFLKKRIDCSRLSCTVEDVSRKCHGLFLYAHYIVEELRLFVDSGKELNKLCDLFPGDIDGFFLQNFKRVHDQVGQVLFNKLFGCAIVAPSPLPVSIISYILKREKVNHDKQQVIDALSQFVVLRTSDQTLNFLHNLIPAWLTDENKARKLFIDKEIAGEFLREIFVEILYSVVNGPQPKRPIIDDKLKDYVSRVAVRFLCQYSETGSLDAVFSCLTNYHFIERRILSGRIDIYHLLEDLKLAACQVPSEEVKKQEILQEIVYALESNVLVLLECPHLLHTCLRNTSTAVQEALLIPQVSVPWLECNAYVFPDTKIADMVCFAASPNKKTVAGAKGRSILFFDTSTAETVNGPFEISSDFIYDIDQLEFSPDGKFLFFGRLDKWLSVERGRVEDFPQFSGNSHVYKWGVLTRDRKSIVVKRNFLCDPSTCRANYCLYNILALWALKEVEQSRDDELTVMFCPQKPCHLPGVLVERLFKCLGIGTNVDLNHETLVPYDPSCHYCCKLKELTEPNQEPSLVTVRQLVIELYPCIINYQVWDLQTGVPVLQQIFSQSGQLNPFTYFCHVACAYSECGLMMGCSGVEKAMSACNMAAVTAVCCILLPGFYFGWELELKRERKRLLELEQTWEQKQKGEEEWKPEFWWLLGHNHEEGRESRYWEKVTEQLEEEPEEGLEEEQEEELEEEVEEGQMRCFAVPLLELELKYWRKLEQELESKFWLEREQELKRELGQALERYKRLIQNWGPELNWMRQRGWTPDWITAVEQTLERSLTTELFKKFQNDVFKCGFYTKIPKAFQDLVCHKVIKEFFVCVSQETKWIIEVDDPLKLSVLQTGMLEHVGSLKLRFLQTGKLEHTISKSKRFSFTDGDHYLVYSCKDSLYALSLQTGAVLTSVSGCNLYYFTRERQVGYLFRSDTEERAVFLSNLFCPFKFLSLSPVKKSVLGNSIAAMFRSSDVVISVSSDSMVTLWKTTVNKEAIAFICKSLLIASGPQAPHVKNCVVSSDGELIAICRGCKVDLYRFSESGVKKFVSNVFISREAFIVTCFAFSADSALLLFCIQDSRVCPHFYVWDIEEEVVSVSFKSPGFLDAECCWLSLNRRELILCGEYEIEMWEYGEQTCRLLKRIEVAKPYKSVKFSQCTVSFDNQFLVCCVADVILVYNLHSPNIHSSRQVLRGHLGKIEFCRFLKVNRYLISYGVDGMVFLWDLTDSKAVGFARVTQDQDSIASMAVSPEEDTAVCFTSSGRVCVIKLCELGSALPLKSLTAHVKGRVRTAETNLPPQEQIALACQILTPPIEDDMAEAMSSSDSEEGFLDYYSEHDLLNDFD